MKLLLALLIYLSTLCVSAQKNVTHANQQWIQYYNSIKINDQFSLYTDLGLRWRNELGEVSQTLMRTGLGYQANQQTRFIVGFAFLTFHKNEETSKVEYRPYQEINISQPFDKFKLQHRLRSEQRFFSSTDESGISSKFNHRFRYRFMMNIPIYKDNEKSKVSINFGDEILINAGKEIEYNMFDGNRILIGPAIQISPSLNISLTYNYLFSQKNAPESFSDTQVIWIGIKHRVDVSD